MKKKKKNEIAKKKMDKKKSDEKKIDKNAKSGKVHTTHTPGDYIRGYLTGILASC